MSKTAHFDLEMTVEDNADLDDISDCVLQILDDLPTGYKVLSFDGCAPIRRAYGVIQEMKPHAD